MRSLLHSLYRILLASAPYVAAGAVPWLICLAELNASMQAPLFALFFAVVVLSRLGGLVVGLLCALSSAVAGAYYFLTPVLTWRLDLDSAHEALLFFIASLTVVFIQDALHKKTAALSNALAMRDEFLAVAGHELGNPLAALQLRAQGQLRKIKRGKATDDPAAWTHFLEGQLESLDRLRGLVDELLDMSRIRAGRLVLNPERVDLVLLVRAVVARFADSAAAAGCTVSIDAPDAPIEGMWDRMRLDQVVTNLLSNALKYGAGAPVTIVVWATPLDARVQIVDHGCGIAAADQSRIFARFERCDKTRSVKGLGLGLWIVKQILEACGGRVAVRSEAGVGSTFEVCLPRHTAS